MLQTISLLHAHWEGGIVVPVTMQLLDRYGAAELQAAILEALSRDVPHPNAVRIALDRRREEQHQPPPVAGNLSRQVQERDVIVRQPRLELYDKLKGQSDEQP